MNKREIDVPPLRRVLDMKYSSLFLCSKEHFSIFFLQYLGMTAGIEPAT
jgi:hypothetical protein